MYILKKLETDHFVGGQMISGKSETLAANGTFTLNDGFIHIIDPGGASRNYNPSGTFPTYFTLILINIADAAETLTFDSSGLNQAVAQNQRGIFSFDGTNWRKVYVG